MFVLSLFSLLSPVAGDQVRPNVLLIVADDLGWNDVGWHNPDIKTPNLDRLEVEGVELDSHYVQPMCTPTRVALMTGRYPSRFGTHCTQASNEQAFPFGTYTLAELFQSAGYATGIFGKWHLGSLPEWGPNHYGFDHSYGALAGAVGIWDHRYRLNRKRFTNTWHRNHELITEEGHSTELITREAIRWLGSQPADKPVFLYWPNFAVHAPVPSGNSRWVEMNSHFANPSRRLFAAYVSHLDHVVGEMLEALHRSGRGQNTLIVFFSDNGGIHLDYPGGKYPEPDPKLEKGFASNLPLRGGKGTTYEGGIRVPAFIHWEGKLRPGKSPLRLHAIDWLPTLAALLGVTLPEDLNLDGVNQWSYLLEQTIPEEHRSVYVTCHETASRVAYLDGDWKIQAHRDSLELYPWRLFNISTDPYEKQDLAQEYPEKLAELVAAFEAEGEKNAHD